MFVASHLLVIQFRRKYVTKCLNFSLTMYVLWHSPKYTCSIQCSSVNKNSTVDGFTYKQTSGDFNFTISALHSFTRSIYNQVLNHQWWRCGRLQELLNVSTSCDKCLPRCMRIIRLSLLSPSSISIEDTGPTLIPMSRYLYAVGVKANLLPNIRDIWRGSECDVL